MQDFICTACGTQYPPAGSPPQRCVICEDERQFLPPAGQSWTTLERLYISHANAFRQYEPGLIGIGTQPVFAIGQRALLIRTPEGNVLWDCISLIDAATVTIIKALGGVRAMAISHPHFYTTMGAWAEAFACATPGACRLGAGAASSLPVPSPAPVEYTATTSPRPG